MRLVAAPLGLLLALVIAVLAEPQVVDMELTLWPWWHWANGGGYIWHQRAVGAVYFNSRRSKMTTMEYRRLGESSVELASIFDLLVSFRLENWDQDSGFSLIDIRHYQ